MSANYTKSKHFGVSKLVENTANTRKPLQAFWTKVNNDWAMSFAGLLAYSLLTAMLPIAIAIFGVFGLIVGSNSRFTQNIAHQLANIVPKTPSTSVSATEEAINLALTQLSKNAGFLLLIAILLAFFGGSRLFIVVESCLDIVYRVRPRTVLRQNMMAFGMLLLFIVLIPIMIFASSAPTLVLNFLGNYPALQSIPFFHAIATNGTIVYIVGIVGSLIVGFILFEAIYVVVPNQRISWNNSWRGALAAAIALELFLLLFPFYATYALKDYTGQIGFAVIIILFFYYFAVILMLGVEVNAFFFEGVRPLPSDLATFVSTMGGTLNEDFPAAEASSHVDPAATERAVRAHVADVSQQEGKQKEENAEKQRTLAANGFSREEKKTKESTAKSMQNAPIVLAVVIGSALAVVIDWFHSRHSENIVTQRRNEGNH